MSTCTYPGGKKLSLEKSRDRVFVSFHEAPSDRQVAAFAGRYGLMQCERYSARNFPFQLTQHTGMNPVKLIVALTENEPLMTRAEND